MTEVRSSRPASTAFFHRRTVTVARALLGATLTVGDGPSRRTVRIVETEAYVDDDPASHAFRGPTARNRSMFGPPGTLYVYRIHQVACANLVTRPGQAVLLRAGVAVLPAAGAVSGPGRLCRFLGLSLEDDGLPVGHGRFRVVPPARRLARVAVGPRIGIRWAAGRLLRFAVCGERAVSLPRPPGWTVSATSPRSSRGGGRSSRSRTTRRRPSGGGRRAGRSGGK